MAVGNIPRNRRLRARVFIGGVGAFVTPVAANRRRIARDSGRRRGRLRRLLVVLDAELLDMGRLVAGRLSGLERYRARRRAARRLSQSPAAMRA